MNDDKIKKLLGEPVANLCQSYLDKFIEKNVEKRHELGMGAVIIRQMVSNCCNWCKGLVGMYEYGTEPKNVYRRHDNCKCLVTYKSYKGGYKDVHSKQEFDRYRDARIERINGIYNSHHESSRVMYMRRILFSDRTPGVGSVVRESGYKTDKHESEIKFADILLNLVGGDIKLLKETNKKNVKTPDYLWNGKFWELKGASSRNSVDQRLRDALKQIEQNPGGVIIHIEKYNGDVSEIEKTIVNRLRRSKISKDVIVIVIKNEKIINIIKQ